MPSLSYDKIVDVSRIGKHENVDFNQKIYEAGVEDTLMGWALRENLSANRSDSVKRLLLCIDVQNDFVEGGSLAVPGSVGDIERITRFIYNNMGSITNIMCSMDTHYGTHIFFPSWWRNADGDYPAPYTVITYDDVKNGRWRPVVGDAAKSLTYLQKLEEQAKKQLCIWPYHCLRGTEGFCLENEFSKMVHYFAQARKTIPRIIQKGTDYYSEMYGIIKPEYSDRNIKNEAFLNAVENYDEIYVVGEAASHCLLESVRQIAEEYANRPEVTSKITILDDCTSPITGFEQSTQKMFGLFERKYGIKFEKSTNIKF